MKREGRDREGGGGGKERGREGERGDEGNEDEKKDERECIEGKRIPKVLQGAAAEVSALLEK